MTTPYSISHARTVHSNARTAWKKLELLKNNSLTPAENLAKVNEAWDMLIKDNPAAEKNRPTDEQITEAYIPWTADDDAVMESLDKVVRELDQFALPKKRVYP